MRIIWIPIAFALCCLAGCVTGQSGQPVLTQEAIETIDAIALVAEPLGLSLGILFPSAAALGGVLAGVAGAWRKMKPQIEEAQDNAEFATIAGEATSVALEEFKKNHPDEWAVLSDYLRDNHGQEVENFYRALRGLPPKG